MSNPNANFQQFQQTGTNPILDLAINISNNVKSAAIGVGGQQYLPMAPGNHGNGIYDPNPANAQMSMLSQVRAQNNQLNYMDGQVLGTNLIPYGGVLPTNSQTIATAVNPPMAIPQGDPNKMASLDGLSQGDFDSMMDKYASAGYFQNFKPGTSDEWNSIVDGAVKDAHAEAKALFNTMLNNGYIDAVMPGVAQLFKG